MASIDASRISTVLADLMPQAVAVCVAQDARFYAYLDAQGAVVDVPPSNKKPPHWKAITDAGHASAGTHSESGPYNTSDRYDVSTARMTHWGKFSEAVSCSEEAWLQMQGAPPEYIADYLGDETLNALRQMFKKINAFMISNNCEVGGNTNSVMGLDDWCSASNTVAGIDRSSYSWWQAKVNSSGGALSTTIINDVLDTLIQTRGGSVDLIFGPIAQLRAACALTPVVTVDRTVQVGGTLLGPSVVGYGNAMDPLAPMAYYDGIPMVAVPGATSARLNFIKLGFDSGGYEFVWLQRPTIGPWQKVQGQPRYQAVITAHAQTRYKNPWANAGAATGLT